MAGAAGAGDGMRGVLLEGSISGGLLEVERRPYHRNCSCALHNKNRNHCSAATHEKPTKVSYSIRRSWSEGSLGLYAAGNPSPSSSPLTPHSHSLLPPHLPPHSGNRRPQQQQDDHDDLFPST